MTDSKNQEAILYMPAEPKLLEYAYRINQDIPIEANVVKFDKMKEINSEGIEDIELTTVTFDKKKSTNHLIEFGLDALGNFSGTIEQTDSFNVDEPVEKHFLTSSYEKVMNIYGQFRQESIALGLSELR